MCSLSFSQQDKTGKSPLQLLAQTCSQIGADTSSNKLLGEKQNGGNSSNGQNGTINSSNGSSNAGDGGGNGSKGKNSRSPALIVTDAKPVSFKPYENSSSSAGKVTSRSSPGKPASVTSLSSPTPSNRSSSSPKMINGKSPSPSSHNNNNNNITKERSSSVNSAGNASAAVSSAASSSSSETTPVIRSGMEVLAGHPKDIPLGTFRFPSALDPSNNPAFRPPFGHSGIPGYPPTSLAAGLSAAATGGGVCRDPYCRDPTCPTAVYNAQIASLSAASSAGLPPGYAELLQAQKLSSMAASGMHHHHAAPTTTSSGSSGSASAAPSALAGPGGPYICNWMNGREGYCGKRHSSAEELLQHLRTHTNLSTTDSSSAAAAAMLNSQSAAAAAAAANMYPPSLLAAGLHRSYPGLGSLAAAASGRFHPYGKPGAGLPPSLGASLAGLGSLGGGIPPAPMPPSLAASLSSIYSNPASLYALYGSRLAGAGGSVLP